MDYLVSFDREHLLGTPQAGRLPFSMELQEIFWHGIEQNCLAPTTRYCASRRLTRACTRCGWRYS